ncbi:MAG: hypothetical protein IPM67_08790 [Sphingomonadales bacterium]|nr:hypothetical protein [Sphingomonadales bacterium]
MAAVAGYADEIFAIAHKQPARKAYFAQHLQRLRVTDGEIILASAAIVLCPDSFSSVEIATGRVSRRARELGDMQLAEHLARLAVEDAIGTSGPIILGNDPVRRDVRQGKRVAIFDLERRRGIVLGRRQRRDRHQRRCNQWSEQALHDISPD